MYSEGQYLQCMAVMNSHDLQHICRSCTRMHKRQQVYCMHTIRMLLLNINCLNLTI